MNLVSIFTFISLAITAPSLAIPNLEVPADLNVDATGYLTAVDLGTATATDGDGNTVSVSADQTGPFESGSYTITWTATDANQNTASATQSLKVNPRANLGPSRYTAEGAEVKVQLSGMAPDYPVVVPFIISGTATEGDDFTVTPSDSISIAAGKSGVINLIITTDEVAESDETIVITISSPTNAALGSVVQQTLTIVDGNVPPAIDLSVSQGAIVGSTVVADGDAVVITVDIDDPNPTDTHTVDWGDALNLSAAVADPETKTLSFSAAGMVGVTTISAEVSDGTDSVMASVSVNVLASVPVLASDVDSDGDGISDADEGYGDSDGDGIPDYADNISVPNAAPSDDGVVETEPGTQITLESLSLPNDIGGTEELSDDLGIVELSDADGLSLANDDNDIGVDADADGLSLANDDNDIGVTEELSDDLGIEPDADADGSLRFSLPTDCGAMKTAWQNHCPCPAK